MKKRWALSVCAETGLLKSLKGHRSRRIGQWLVASSCCRESCRVAAHLLVFARGLVVRRQSNG